MGAPSIAPPWKGLALLGLQAAAAARQRRCAGWAVLLRPAPDATALLSAAAGSPLSSVVALCELLRVFAAFRRRAAAAFAAPWTDDRWWASGFPACRSHEERLARLQQWVEMAGGQFVVVEGGTMARLPKLQPGMARAELIRFCRQLRVPVREAVQ